MKRAFKIMLLFFSLTLLSSCGKEGPEGALGPQGDSGAAGLAGPAGKDGSIIYNGSTSPASSVGKVGDYYVNTRTGDFYGPKISSGWGAPFNLRGAKGDKGDTGIKGDKGDKGGKGDKGDNGSKGDKGDKGDKGEKGDRGDNGSKGDKGSQVFSGNGTPLVGLGAVGDYYLDKTSYILYGPKQSASVWGPGLMLQGKEGNANVKSFILSNFSVPITPKILGIRVPAITKDILENGAVLAYLRVSPVSDTQTISWKFFPVFFPITSQGLTLTMTLDNMQPGYIYLNQGDYPWRRYISEIDIRIVIIQGLSGGVLIRRQNQSPILFEELKVKYHLSD